MGYRKLSDKCVCGVGGEVEKLISCFSVGIHMILACSMGWHAVVNIILFGLEWKASNYRLKEIPNSNA